MSKPQDIETMAQALDNEAASLESSFAGIAARAAALRRAAAALRRPVPAPQERRYALPTEHAVLAALGPGLTHIHDIASRGGFCLSTLRPVVRSLVAKGALRRVGATKNTAYSLPTPEAR
jgi:hypothetical protein